ncbi:putative leucine-rich repeat domain superfamily [Helianthus annuus]|uniref:Leucine-rich repeat domain superfamily n=1 Tax=Helianthus annuus TaxID=4232 RepID=A0A9K3GTE6_HELAN|nr:putative leucine-rich repeat domain superfamily [Helianthus annuus]
MGDRKRVNVEGDRLSSLPDDLIHKILSLFAPNMPFKQVYCHPGGVSSVELTSRGKVVQACDERILSYAFSHNVQEVNITFLPEKKIEFPVSLFSSQSLKNLTLTGCTWRVHNLSITTPPTWELQTLATLNLHFVTLHDANTDKGDSLFSHCANLKNLTLKHCRLVGLNGFNISHPGLSSLTLEDSSDGVNVVTPQLKNLIIKGWQGILLISAPNLSSLHYEGSYDSLQLSTDLFHLEKVDVCLSYPSNALKTVCLLQHFRSVKFLTLNLEIVKVCLYWSLMLSTYNSHLTVFFFSINNKRIIHTWLFFFNKRECLHESYH